MLFRSKVKDFLKNRDAYAYDTDNPSNPYRYLPPPRRNPAAQPAAGESPGVKQKTAPTLPPG